MAMNPHGKAVKGYICPECHRAWEQDEPAITLHYSEVERVPEFVGRTLGEYRDHLRTLRDGIYDMDESSQYRNSKLVDLSKEPGRDWAINPSGWFPVPYTHAPFAADHIIEPDDEIYWKYTKYYHPGCYKSYLRTWYESRFRKVFTSAGFEVQSMDAQPNQYSGDEFASPWFRVQTKFGDFHIGWRKRVINIDWPRDLNLQHLFLGENVTQDSSSIHAWGWDKATEYLRRMCKEKELAIVDTVHRE